jgi:uncharacterized GH25 family protein
MKKIAAAVAFVAALALPFTASAHRAWIAPTATVLSGDDAWVGFDAGMSNGVFIPDHAAMNLAGLVITAPDGTPVTAEHINRSQYRSTFDLHLTQQGTYRVANVTGGIGGSYMLNGERQRFRAATPDYASELPAGATDIQVSRSVGRTETFVTLGEPSSGTLAPTGVGIELVPVSHPNDLVAGETATFKLVHNGQLGAGMEVIIARGGTRYRNAPEEMTVTTGADGSFTVTWPTAGMYWINASIRTEASSDQLAYSAQYNGVVEVLP